MNDPNEWFNSENVIAIGGRYVTAMIYDPDCGGSAKTLKPEEIQKLSLNDGFDSCEDFFAWFNEDFSGKIIHWTPFRYDPRSIEVNDATIVKAPADVRNCDCWLENESCKCQTK